MKRNTPDTPSDTLQEPAHDYDLALKSAVSWLGDRYLLAEPQTRLPSERPKYWTSWRHAAAHVARRPTRH